MQEQIIIRKADVSDLPSILKLYSQVEEKDEEVLSLEEAEIIFDKFSSYPNYSLYAAILDKKIVGTFELLIMDNLAHKGKLSGLVEDVVVDREYRSKGIGKKMMEYAIQVCKENKCYKLALSSSLSREKAHKFYENLGFEKHGYSFLIEP